MPTSAGGLPYPAGTDFLAAGDDAINLLTQKIEQRYQAGGSNITITATGGLSLQINFPLNYASAPVVVACLQIGSGAPDVFCYVQSVNTSGFIVRVMKSGAIAPSGDTYRVNWIAIGIPT